MPTIQVNGSLHYYEQAGDGAPLVFIHGAFADADLWQPQWQYFSAKYQVLRYDLRGHGRSGSSSLAEYTITTFAEDLAALLDTLEIRSPVICGLSLGGVIAQAFAVHSPERLRALILASAPVSASLTLGEKLVRHVFMPEKIAVTFIRMLGVKRFTRFSIWLARRLWGENWLGQQAEIAEYVESHMRQMDSAEYLKLWKTFYSFDPLPLERITCPTLVLNGANESAGTLRHTAEILRRIPRARSAILPGAAHAIPLENPQAFNLEVDRFLGDINKPQSHFIPGSSPPA